MPRYFAFLVVVAGLLVCEGCGSQFANSYDREVDLTGRAGRDRISEKEKEKLLQESHPILMQMADPALRGILQLFAQLPNEQLDWLNEKQFLKWRYADLDPVRREVFDQVLLMNLRMLREEDAEAHREKLLKMLAQCDVGFAVVQIPSSGERVVSCYVLWPDKLFPTWITVANSKAAMTEDANTAHLTKLAALKALTHSSLPPAIAKQAINESNEESSVSKNSNAQRSRPIASQTTLYQLR